MVSSLQTGGFFCSLYFHGFLSILFITILQLAEMNDFSVYLDPNATSMSGLSGQEFFDAFAKLVSHFFCFYLFLFLFYHLFSIFLTPLLQISTAGSSVGHHYLINPISAAVKVNLILYLSSFFSFIFLLHIIVFSVFILLHTHF